MLESGRRAALFIYELLIPVFFWNCIAEIFIR